MTIILFLIDTSSSMNQKTYLGARPTLLDVAKDAVEKFLKLRQRDAASRGDRYMLLTFEDSPANIKAGWKEHHNVFINELKNLTANGMTTYGQSLKNAFDLLNLNRMQTGIDTYGQGRCPYYLEPSIIIVITDGSKLTTTTSVQDELVLPMNSNVPGSELTKEPFRWDQRLFAVVLRLNGTPPTDHLSAVTNGMIPAENSAIDAMCDVTGGRSYSVASQRSLMQCLESIVQKIQGGVVIQFDKVGPDPPLIIPGEEESVEGQVIPTNGSINVNNGVQTNGNGTKPVWHSTRKLIYVQRSAQKGYSVGHWPIPEAFWPDLNLPSLPPRSAHPVIKVTCTNSEPMVIDNLPFDKYELETSPLTNFILARKQPHVSWQCFVANSHKGSELGHPFGYLKASTNLSCVNLFVLPYNYPVLLPLLDELFKVHHCKHTREWRMQFDSYLKNMPLYYAAPLKRAMQRMGANTNLVPDSMENCLSYSVLNYLKRLKNQAKVEFDKVVVSVGSSKPSIPDSIRVTGSSYTRKINELSYSSNPALSSRFATIKNDLNDFQGFMMRINDKTYEAKPQIYKNPYDITRRELIEQINRMRNNFLLPVGSISYQDEDQIHNLPVSQMGNYQEYLKRMPMPLRELESAPVRQHMFGNPFKFDKKGMMIDEADIDLVNGNGGMKSPKRPTPESFSGTPRVKRKPGPLPKDFTIRRPYSPSSPMSLTPPPSPSPSTSSSPCPSPLPPYSPLPSPDSHPPLSPQPFLTEKTVKIEPTLTSNGPESESLPGKAPQISTNHIKKEEIDQDYEPAKVPLIDAESDMSLSVHETVTQSVSTTVIASANVTATPKVEPINGKISLTVNSNHVDVNGRINDSDDKRTSLVSNTNGSDNSSTELNNHIVNNNNNNIDNRRYLTREDIDIRKMLFKLIRKPGKNYDDIVDLIHRFKGPMRDYMLQQVMHEATRFKRKALVDCLRHKFEKHTNCSNKTVGR